MWTRSAKNKETGKIAVVCIDWNGNEFFRGEFANLNEANQAGEDAERRMTIAMQAGDLEPIECELTDDELLAELLA